MEGSQLKKDMLDFEKDIELCLQVLKDGGLILYPTDTIWGIGCDATNEAAVNEIYALKKRPDEKAMIVLVADEKDVLQYTAAPDLAVFDHLQKTKRPTNQRHRRPNNKRHHHARARPQSAHAARCPPARPARQNWATPSSLTTAARNPLARSASK